MNIGIEPSAMVWSLVVLPQNGSEKKILLRSEIDDGVNEVGYPTCTQFQEGIPASLDSQ